MAYMVIEEYTDIGTGQPHDATSWQFYLKRNDVEHIIEESLNDRINLTRWESMLPRIPEDGDGYYKDLDEVCGRFKIHAGEFESEWFEAEPKSQNVQDVIITEDGKDDIITDSDSINLQTGADNE